MFLVSRPSKRFSTSSLYGGKKGRGENRVRGVSTSLRIQGGVWEVVWHRGSSLIHVEGQGDVLILGEEQDQEVVAGLALLYRGVQADLEREEEVKTQNPPKPPLMLFQGRAEPLPLTTKNIWRWSLCGSRKRRSTVV